MGLPVYARGAWSNDIKYEGTTVAYNSPVSIGGVQAQNDDVIFADGEGVVVIPASYWSNVLEQAMLANQKESHIRHGLLQGKSVEEILDSFGFF